MHRRTLILRRFGALSFGLGYMEGNSWIDHVPGDGLVADASVDVQTVHAWLGCCSPRRDETFTLLPVGHGLTEPIAVLARSASS